MRSICSFAVLLVVLATPGSAAEPDNIDSAKPLADQSEKSKADPLSPDHPDLGVFVRADSSDGAETARELIERLYEGLRAGDGEKVASCFDRTTEDGRIAAAGFAVRARLNRAGYKLEQAAQKKFGAAGAIVIRDNTDVDTEAALDESHAVHTTNASALPILGDESTGRLIVRLPIQQIRPPSLLHEPGAAFRLICLRDGRWYLVEPTACKLSAFGKELFEAQLELWLLREELWEDNLETVAQCNSIEELCQFCGCDVPEVKPVAEHED